MSYITTYTGKHFDPVEPDENLLDLIDIAHALSLICRANGCCKHFYSVAQHSIACAEEAVNRGYTRDIVLACLLHDASEAYLSDVTRPVKKDLTYYLEVEDRLQNLIWCHFIGHELSSSEREKVFEIDDQMLSMEFHVIMPEDIDEKYKQLTQTLSCSFEVPSDVEKKFMNIFDKIKGREI